MPSPQAERSTTPESRRAAVHSWLTGDHPRSGPLLMAGVRVTLGLMWLSNLGWKIPPTFGKGSDGGLYTYVTDAVSHPVFPPYSWLVEQLIVPNFTLFGVGVLAAETLLAALLLTGTFTRAAAAVGIVQSIAIGLSVAAAPGEWPWSYVLMVAGHVAVLAASPLRVPGVDAVLLAREEGGWPRPRRLLLAWGVVAAVIGLWAAAGSLGDPLGAGSGTGLAVLELSLGQFNVLGGLLMVLIGVALAMAGVRHDPRLAQVAGGVAAVAALSVVVRWGFGSVLIGGNGTSTGLLLAVALVGVLLGRSMTASALRPGRQPSAAGR